jgi:hypothetical protein
MVTTRIRLPLRLAALAAAALIAWTPLGARAAEDPQGPPQPPPGKGTLVVEKVENGPAFGIEFKFTEVNHSDAYLLGGYAGYTFDGKLFVGGAGYWQVDDYWNDYYGYDDYSYGGCDHGCGDGYGYHGATGYGGLVVEWFPLRSPVVSVSARGLVGGGVTTVGWDDYVYIQEPSPRHGSVYPPPYGYYWYDQTYFVFEPQVNVSLRIVPGLAVVGGVGYRVIGWANGWEDQIQGLTGTFAIRIGGR